ncbi:MAG TPA: hypothetical protein VFV94_08280 [Polyangiaceae bacterium]|nr:hypothetical protein [Polyangiaceae bacterium]
MTPTALDAPLLAELRARARSWARTHGVRAAVVLGLAFVTTRAVLRTTGGVPAVPLDDSFIHFQYARSFWEGRGFAFSPGAAPVAGATSLLWPLLLALPYGLGLRAERLVWAAWAFGWVALGLLGHETRQASKKLLSPDGALAAEALVLCFGGHVWFAASGMEVVPLAWLLLRAVRRSAEWLELPERTRSVPRELVLLAWLGPLMRPEGVLATLACTVAILAGARGRKRVLAVPALLGAAAPPLVNALATGSATTTTALVKWLPLSPYCADLGKLWRAVLANVELLFGTLLNGEIWSAVFLPQHSGLFLWLAVPALVALGFRNGVRARALLLAGLCAGMLIPTTYDSFLWNRLRYLWPFTAGFLIGVAALADWVGVALARFEPGLERLRLLVSGIALGGLLSHLGWTIDDLATSSDAIRRQQAALGHWAAAALPSGTTIGVNDTGAIAYFSGHRVFDVVGLTTRAEARYWVAGTGSRLEHYERLGKGRLPATFIVYPEWFGLPSLLGEYRTERRVSGATILGGETMVAYDADYSRLGSGARPTLRPHDEGALLDELDVADLESEHDHRYALFDAVALDDVALDEDGVLDGGRKNRRLEHFELKLAPRGVLVARLEGDRALRVEVRAAGATLAAVELVPDAWREVEISVPATLDASRPVAVELEAKDGAFTALHYWSYRPDP